MTKIRCQICGSEKLHAEGNIIVICDDCGNRTLIIPEVAITDIDNSINNEIVTIQYDKRRINCPGKSFCLNDKKNSGSEPCKTCNVVKNKLNHITQEMINKFDERQNFIKNHPELCREQKEQSTNKTWV